MQYISAPVATWCRFIDFLNIKIFHLLGIGQASSMGSLLLAAGEKGMRHSLPNARIMVRN